MLYRMKEDRLPSGIVLALLGVQLWVVFTVENLVVLLLVALALLLFSAVPGSISHNHHHYPTFRQHWLNRCYEVILFLQTGIPPLAWTLHHNLGHHKDYLDQGRDPSGWLNADGSVMSRVKYDVYNALRVYPEVLRIGRSRPKLYAKFKLWTGVSLAVLAVLLFLRPVPALIVFVLPMPIMLLGLLDNTYSQHSDMDIGSDFTASRNTTNRFYNMVSWNLGYHTAHHLRPSLHWSKLPAYHEAIRVQIPADCQCDSVFLGKAGFRYSRDRGPHQPPVERTERGDGSR